MLATLVIGLREGLEAALVVGIIAAFLKRNGQPLAAMWWGVAAAVVASLAVGIGLWTLEANLPQAAQEGLETVIGLLAVAFVTGMLVWMSGHARSMKRELESSAQAALGTGTARALALMAFLAVLKEGFETSVFLLATFRAAVSPGVAATGAVTGIVGAIAIGYGIYRGGIRLNLVRFFRFTGVFLLLVAGGLLLTAVRTAHGAGWIEGGQQRTVDLSWLAPPGSIQASLVTGVLGIPADPRLVEVVAWFAYVVPLALVVFLPERLKPHGRAATRTRLGLAAGLAGTGVVVSLLAGAALAPAGSTPLALQGGGSASLASGAVVLVGAGGARSRTDLADGQTVDRRGITAVQHPAVRTTGTAAGPATLTLAELTADNGGRVPVGIDPTRARGPFDAAWSAVTVLTAWTADGRLVDVETSTTRVLTVSGGGLAGARTLTVGAATAVDATAASATRAAAAVTADATASTDRLLWAVQVPVLLLLAALLLAGSTLLRARRAVPATAPDPSRSRSYAVK